MKFYAESCVENDEDAAPSQADDRPQEPRPRLLDYPKCVARLVKIILRASFHLFMLQDEDPSRGEHLASCHFRTRLPSAALLAT